MNFLKETERIKKLIANFLPNLNLKSVKNVKISQAKITN
jgi:hypothetical protein